jgi:hypothetical protein
MPNRILREGLLESPAIDLLDAEAERFFVRLMLRADDFGRYHANPAMLANMLFPMRRDIEPKQVADWLKQCQQAKLLRVYQVEGRDCLEIAKFGGKPRAQQSKFPKPPPVCEQLRADDSNCVQMRPYSYSDAYSYASASAVALPSLDEVIEEGRKRQISADICQRWFNACEERPLTQDGGWTLRNGQPMNMDKWAASLANYASAFKSNESTFNGKNGHNGSPKPTEGVWHLEKRIEAAQKEVDRIQANPANKEQVPDSFDRRLKAEPMAKVKALKASISEMRQRMAGVEVAA